MKLLVIRDREHGLELLQKYQSMRCAREHLALFEMHLFGRKDSYFLEVGENEGLVYFTNVAPRYKADFNCVFWDGKLSADRRASVKGAVVDVFRDFALVRVQAEIAARNVPMATFLRRLGFVYEGTRRQDWVDAEAVDDRMLYGMLRSEVNG